MSINELFINILWVVGTLWVASLVAYVSYKYLIDKGRKWKDNGEDYK